MVWDVEQVEAWIRERDAAPIAGGGMAWAI
jgi:hypothetical protein